MGLCERIAKALRTHYQRIAKVTNCYQVLPLATKNTTGSFVTSSCINLCGSLKRVKLRTVFNCTESCL